MDRKVLVTYASKYGATQEIAEKIADVLRLAGLQVDIFPVNGVRGMSAYQAVILGSGVYIGKWNKEAAAFLQANEKELANRPVWLFSSGPTGVGDAVKLVDGWRLPTDLQQVADRIHPRDIAVFHGYINENKINFIEKFAIKSLVKKPFGDFRDWNAIVTWANAVAVELKYAEAVR